MDLRLRRMNRGGWPELFLSSITFAVFSALRQCLLNYRATAGPPTLPPSFIPRRQTSEGTWKSSYKPKWPSPRPGMSRRKCAMDPIPYSKHAVLKKAPLSERQARFAHPSHGCVYVPGAQGYARKMENRGRTPGSKVG